MHVPIISLKTNKVQNISKNGIKAGMANVSPSQRTQTRDGSCIIPT